MQGLISEDYLMHHGVKGMKWGVRHDPEPLGKRISNQAINRIEKRRSQKMAETERYKNTKYGKWVRDVSNRNYDRATSVAKKAGNGLSSNQKKILKGVATGAAIAGASAIGIAALKSGAGKVAISKGAKYLRMGKTDAKIMKIGVQDAIANSKAVNRGKSVISNSKLASNISRKARMARTDAKIVKIGAKDSANKIIDKVYDVPRRVGNTYRSARYDAGESINKARSSAAKKLYKVGNKVAPERNVKKYRTYQSSVRKNWRGAYAVPKYRTKGNIKVIGKTY